MLVSTIRYNTHSIVPFIIKVSTIDYDNHSIVPFINLMISLFFIKFYINTAAKSVAIAVDGCVISRGRAQLALAPAQKIRTTHTSPPRRARQEVDGERTHAR